jgi:hypothetical protein
MEPAGLPGRAKKLMQPYETDEQMCLSLRSPPLSRLVSWSNLMGYLCILDGSTPKLPSS